MSRLQNFEPQNRWANPDGTLTERALGFLRNLFVFIGADTGTTPVGTLGGDGATTTRFYREDGSFAIPAYPTGANPTGSIGLTAVNGSAATFLRSDGAPVLDQAITPTWTGDHIFQATVTCTSSITGDSLVATNGFGCNGQTAQTEAAIGAAIVTTAATNSSPYGYATQAQADDIVARVNTIRAALIANGILV